MAEPVDPGLVGSANEIGGDDGVERACRRFPVDVGGGLRDVEFERVARDGGPPGEGARAQR
jgi:hypothetical protein